MEHMSEEDKKPLLPETNFLPPLDMVLTFFDRTFKKSDEKKNSSISQEESEEKNVEKLIIKISDKGK